MATKAASRKVYELIKNIPAGRVMTYGQIARITGIASPRAVGQILHRNEQPEIYPCHRVVFADGSLSEAFAFGGSNEQKIRLMSEGVSFKGDKVNMKLHLL